jgi:hypothetical protein
VGLSRGLCTCRCAALSAQLPHGPRRPPRPALPPGTAPARRQREKEATVAKVATSVRRAGRALSCSLRGGGSEGRSRAPAPAGRVGGARSLAPAAAGLAGGRGAGRSRGEPPSPRPLQIVPLLRRRISSFLLSPTAPSLHPAVSSALGPAEGSYILCQVCIRALRVPRLLHARHPLSPTPTL